MKRGGVGLIAASVRTTQNTWVGSLGHCYSGRNVERRGLNTPEEEATSPSQLSYLHPFAIRA
eukprot:2828475-Rhodomonas_salina.2